jgi:hypothetical protein
MGRIVIVLFMPARTWGYGHQGWGAGCYGTDQSEIDRYRDDGGETAYLSNAKSLHHFKPL